MTVHILIVDDGTVTIAAKLFSQASQVEAFHSTEFNFEMHSSFRSGRDDEPIGIKVFKFDTNNNNEISYCQLQQILDRGCSDGDSKADYWIIYLDLKFDNAGDPTNIWNVSVFNPIHLLVCPDNDHNSELCRLLQEGKGLALAVHIMRKTNWRGLLCIASGLNKQHAEIFMNRYGAKSLERHWHALDGGIRSAEFNDDLKFREGLAKFCEIFGFDGLIRWWLIPPGGQRVWFPCGTNLHNPGNGNEPLHYNKVAERFGESENWKGPNDGGYYSKDIFHINDANAPKLVHCQKSVPAELISRILGGAVQLDGIKESDLVTLPCSPALPFLWSAKHALGWARTENRESENWEHKNAPLLLKRCGDRFALALRQSLDATKLVTKVNDGIDAKNHVSGAIRDALCARVACPAGAEYEQSIGAALLKGFENPIAEVKWDAQAKELQIIWPVKSKN